MVVFTPARRLCVIQRQWYYAQLSPTAGVAAPRFRAAAARRPPSGCPPLSSPPPPPPCAAAAVRAPARSLPRQLCLPRPRRASCQPAVSLSPRRATQASSLPSLSLARALSLSLSLSHTRARAPSLSPCLRLPFLSATTGAPMTRRCSLRSHRHVGIYSGVNISTGQVPGTVVGIPRLLVQLYSTVQPHCSLPTRSRTTRQTQTAKPNRE